MNPYLAIILNHLLEILVLILAPVIVTVAIRFFSKKLNLQIDEAKEKRLHEVLMHAIGYADEWARKKLVTTGEKPPAALKLEEALEWAQEEAVRRGLDKMATEKLEALLLAKLGLTRTPGEPVVPRVIRDDVNAEVTSTVPPVTDEEAGGTEPPPVTAGELAAPAEVK